jgi:hypothetical protein
MRLLLAGVLFLSAAASACSSDEDQTRETPPVPVESDAVIADVTTSSTAESPEVVAVDAAPCDLLTAADVEAATGFTVVEVVDDPPLTCIFDLGDDVGVDVFVVTEDGEGRLAGSAAVFAGYSDLATEGGAELVDGLGEEAYYSQDFRGLAVDVGQGRFVGVGINGGFSALAEPRDVLVDLAQVMLGRL